MTHTKNLFSKIWEVFSKLVKFTGAMFAGFFILILAAIPPIIGLILLISPKFKALQIFFMYIGWITCSVMFIALIQYLRTGKNIFKIGE